MIFKHSSLPRNAISASLHLSGRALNVWPKSCELLQFSATVELQWLRISHSIRHRVSRSREPLQKQGTTVPHVKCRCLHPSNSEPTNIVTWPVASPLPLTTSLLHRHPFPRCQARHPAATPTLSFFLGHVFVSILFCLTFQIFLVFNFVFSAIDRPLYANSSFESLQLATRPRGSASLDDSFTFSGLIGSRVTLQKDYS